MRPFPEISKSGLFAFLLIGCTLAAIPSAQAQFSELAQLNNSPLQILPLYDFAAAQAADPADSICQRFAAGSVAQTPPQLVSQNGLLEVTFHFRTTVDAQGLTRYCYVTDTGLESPTLVVNPGDQLTLHFENDISGTAASASARQMPGMVMRHASAAASGDCNAQTMDATSTNLHFHGFNASPTCHQDEVLHTLIAAGQTFDYSVQVPANEPAGLYWYHPHPHGFSEGQVIGGASGALIVQGIQNFNPAVAGLPTRVFMIRDQKLTAAEQSISGGVKPANDLSLNFVPVTYPNYQPAIIQTPALEKEFWRVANTSADTLVDLQYLINGTAQQITVVAIDGVPLTDASGNPTTSIKTDAVLPPGTRAEFIVTTPPAGATAQLVTLTWNNGTGFDIDPGRPLADIVASASSGRRSCCSSGVRYAAS